MYEELLVKFKNGSSDSFSPLEEMKLEYDDNKIVIHWYGTLSVFNEVIELKDIYSIVIKNMNEETYKVISEKVIYNENINNIEEFDNLNNSTYGILKR